MTKVIGIRREDKNEWERRTPLIPSDVKELKEKYGIKTIVQPSKIRIYTDEEFKNAGAEINEDLSEASVVLAVKEIPISLFQQKKTYVFFSHTIKAQPYNMPMLKHMANLQCNLIDYERVVNEKNQRLIFFGKYAGLAGMIDTLHAFGQKLKLQGYSTPLERIKKSYEYKDLQEAEKEIKEIGEEINENGFPPELAPIVFAFTGYGNVSRGAQEIFNLLPFKAMSPEILFEMHENFTADNYHFYKIVFSEEDLVRPKDHEATFDLQDYYKHPEKYESKFEKYLPYINVLVNGIFWNESYPRFVRKEYLDNEAVLSSNLPLQVIGDISCDIDGSIEITTHSTKPDKPTYTYFPGENRYEEGTHRLGVTVMAVDNLPCEFSKESSQAFSAALKDFVNDMVTEDFNASYENLKLPYPLKTALVLHQGTLTPEYEHLKEHIQ